MMLVMLVGLTYQLRERKVADVWYWVMQVLRGETIAHGPYKSSEARDNRMDKISGGEVTPFKSFSSDPKVAIDEFKAEQLV